MSRRTGLLLLGLLAWVAVAESATYYVRKSGGGSTCSNAAPCLTIGAGLSKLSGGDTLLIGAGTYAENMVNAVPSGSAGAPTTVQAEGGAFVELLLNGSSDAGLNIEGASYIVIDGIHVNCNNNTNLYGVYFGTSAHHLTLKNLRVHHCYNQGLLISSPDSLFDNLEVDNNGFGTNNDQAHGFYMSRGSLRNILRNSNLHHNRWYGAQNAAEEGGVNDNSYIGNRFHHNATGLFAGNGSNLLVMNNLFYNNTYWGLFMGNARALNNSIVSSGDYGILSTSSGQGGTVRNNIARDNVSNIDLQSGNTVSHNLCNSTSTYCQVAGNPNWVNAATGDFHLQASSTAAIDQGVNLSEVTTSFYGTSRPQPPGGLYDIGADEYGVADTTPASVRSIQNPSTTQAGSVITPAPTAHVVNAIGQLVTTATNVITVALGNAAGATLSGTLTKTAVAGSATFDNLSVNLAGTGYTLVYTTPSLAGDTSNPFTVTAGPVIEPPPVGGTPAPQVTGHFFVTQ